MLDTILLPYYNIQNNTFYERIFREADEKLTKFFSIQELKRIAKTDFTLAQMLSKKIGQDLLKKFPKGFSIMDIIFFDKQISTQNVPENIRSLKLKTDIVYGATVWKGAQIYFKDKVNHVFQLNWKTWPKTNDTISSYVRGSNHPTSRKDLTLAWCRYTIFDNYVVLDEIQTDMDDEEFLGKKFMEGWDVLAMRAFIDFVRHKLRIRKIYMPTYDTKLDLYNANPPMYLYKELPNKFGFKKTSDLDGFMILEKKIKKYTN